MIPIVDKYNGLFFLNPINICSVHTDSAGDTIIKLSSLVWFTTSKPLEEVVKLIEKELSNPQGAD